MSALVATLKPNTGVLLNSPCLEVDAIVSADCPMPGVIANARHEVLETLQHIFMGIFLVARCNDDQIDVKSLTSGVFVGAVRPRRVINMKSNV